MADEKKKLIKLESLRGFASVYVVFHHSFPKHFSIAGIDLSFLFKFGQEAVILFFILSGFVIAYSFEKSSDKSFKSYFFKRFFRIYVPLIAVYLCNYLVVAIDTGFFLNINWGNLAGNLFMLQDVVSLKPNVITGPFLGNLPLWSLSYEWWFYMIFYFVARYFKGKDTRVVYLLGTLSAISYIFFPFFINRIFLYLVIWWSGVELARAYLIKQKIDFKDLIRPLSLLLLCSLILLLNIRIHIQQATSIGISPILEFRHFAFALVIIFIGWAWYKSKWLLFSKTIGLFTLIAPISFGIYISHYFLVAEGHYLSFIHNYIIEFILYLLICISFAYLVERKLYIWTVKRFFLHKK